MPGITGALLTTAFAAFLVDLLLRHTVCPQANYFFAFGQDIDISILNLLWKWIPVPFLYELPALAILFAYMGLICFVFSALDKHRARRGTAV